MFGWRSNCDLAANKAIVMDRIPLVRVAQFAQVVSAIEAAGASPERVLRNLGVPMWHHCAPDGFVPCSHFHRLFDRAARVVGCATFGVMVTELLPLRQLGDIGPQIARAPHVYGALAAVPGILRRNGTAKQWWLAEGCDNVWLCRGGGVRFEEGEDVTSQYALASMVQLVRLGAGERWRPSEVRFQGAGAAGLQATEMFAEARIVLDPAVSAIAVPRALLSLPLQQTMPPRAHGGARDEAYSGREPPADDFAGSLRQVIGTLLAEGCPTVWCAAEIVGLHVRTLQRRLDREGVSYRKLVDQARLEAASRSLSDPDVTVTELAFDLGYSDVAHFTRAFRRWVGVSPRQYRRLRLAS